MNADRPNVLFLTVDALRADRTSLLGYDRPTTPRLDALSKNALVCTNTVSPAAFTQPSFHAFLTSSPPFSYGGYDRGAFDRPATVFQAFHEAGYETHVLSTFQWISGMHGYDRGIDHEHCLYVINALIGSAGVTLRSHIENFRDGRISGEALAATAKPVVERLFDTLERYCAKRAEDWTADRVDFAHSRLVNDGYHYQRIMRLVNRHRAEFGQDEVAYVERYMRRPFLSHEWLAAEWRLYRTFGKLVSEGLFEAGNRVLDMVNPRRAALRHMRYKRYVDGASLADRIIRILGNRTSEKPFLLWTHFIDTHIPYCAGTGPRWYEETPDYLESLGHSRDLDVSVGVRDRPQTPEEWATWSALYDAAVLYVDTQIGRVLDALDRLGLRDNTLVVVCGDHGEELGEHGDISHHFRFYSHNVRVPLIFYHPAIEGQRIDGLTTLLDVAPTLAGLTGVRPDPRWEGEEITSASVRDRGHVVLEVFHSGNCAFDERPLYMAVRSKRYNYLWKEYRDPTDRFSPEGHELYDLEADPLEQNNLYRPDHPLVAEFNRIIAERLREIPQVAPERIAKLLGGAASPAVTGDGRDGAAGAGEERMAPDRRGVKAE